VRRIIRTTLVVSGSISATYSRSVETQTDPSPTMMWFGRKSKASGWLSPTGFGRDRCREPTGFAVRGSNW